MLLQNLWLMNSGLDSSANECIWESQQQGNVCWQMPILPYIDELCYSRLECLDSLFEIKDMARRSKYILRYLVSHYGAHSSVSRESASNFINLKETYHKSRVGAKKKLKELDLQEEALLSVILCKDTTCNWS